MCQFGVWPNCCNNCDFCLREARIPYSKEQQIKTLEFINENINHIDWKYKYSYGISLLGGELYHIKDIDIQRSFLKLIDNIIEKVLTVSKNPLCKYSTVTNGIYEPSFLYTVIDKIKNSVGMDKIDLNFSYDLKYRYKSEDDRKLVLKNINEFHEKYDYAVGVQMILTQNLINMWKAGQFEIGKFVYENIDGNNLCFLYPHPIKTGMKLDDFNFRRKDFIEFVRYMKLNYPIVYRSFVLSTKNSAEFKMTGYKYRDSDDVTQQPIFCDGKDEITECGHSILYRCYSDSNRCMMCDLEMLDDNCYLK